MAYIEDPGISDFSTFSKRELIEPLEKNKGKEAFFINFYKSEMMLSEDYASSLTNLILSNVPINEYNQKFLAVAMWTIDDISRLNPPTGLTAANFDKRFKLKLKILSKDEKGKLSMENKAIYQSDFLKYINYVYQYIKDFYTGKF